MPERNAQQFSQDWTFKIGQREEEKHAKIT